MPRTLVACCESLPSHEINDEQPSTMLCKHDASHIQHVTRLGTAYLQMQHRFMGTSQRLFNMPLTRGDHPENGEFTGGIQG